METPKKETKNAISLPIPSHSALAEVLWLFLRLGFTAFGGPAAHIAMMHEEVVRAAANGSVKHTLLTWSA